mgnify:CR=1 FL=1
MLGTPDKNRFWKSSTWRPFEIIPIIQFDKVHVFWEGHKILRTLHLTFVLCSANQKQVEEFVAFSEYMNFEELDGAWGILETHFFGK